MPRSLAAALDKKQLEVNSMPIVSSYRVFRFVWQGQHDSAQCPKIG